MKKLGLVFVAGVLLSTGLYAQDTFKDKLEKSKKDIKSINYVLKLSNVDIDRKLF